MHASASGGTDARGCPRSTTSTVVTGLGELGLGYDRRGTPTRGCSRRCDHGSGMHVAIRDARTCRMGPGAAAPVRRRRLLCGHSPAGIRPGFRFVCHDGITRPLDQHRTVGHAVTSAGDELRPAGAGLSSAKTDVASPSSRRRRTPNDGPTARPSRARFPVRPSTPTSQFGQNGRMTRSGRRPSSRCELPRSGCHGGRVGCD